MWSCGEEPPSLPSPDYVAEIQDTAIAATLGISLEDYRDAVAEGQTPCQIAEAQGLNLVEAWAAGESTRETIIQQAVVDELITQAEADQLTQMLADPPEWCPIVAEVRDTAIAATLGMSLEDYRDAVAAEQTLCQIAEAQGLNLAEAWAAGESTRETIIQQAIENELITHVEAGWLREKLADPPESCPNVAEVLDTVPGCITVKEGERVYLPSVLRSH